MRDILVLCKDPKLATAMKCCYNTLRFDDQSIMSTSQWAKQWHEMLTKVLDKLRHLSPDPTATILMLLVRSQGGAVTVTTGHPSVVGKSQQHKIEAAGRHALEQTCSFMHSASPKVHFNHRGLNSIKRLILIGLTPKEAPTMN